MPSARPLRPLALAALALWPALAAAQEVGTAGAVNPATTATPPSRGTRVLELGSRIIFRERVNTTASGNAQLIFLDKTTMSIGPNSQVVIDEFVYDPNAGTGRLTASVAKGVLRYVGGNISHSGGAQIRTPAATLGIRGGAATVQVTCSAAGAASCSTKTTLHFGELRVQSASGTEVIRRAGFTVTVAAPGAAPSSATRVTQAEVDEANQNLTSKPGQTGGGRASPAAVERANVAGPLIAEILPGTVAVQSRNQARQQTLSTALGLSRSPTDAQTVTQLQARTSNIGQQVTQQNTRVAPEESPAPAAVHDVAGSPIAFALAYEGGPTPTILPRPVAAAAGNLYNSPVLSITDGGRLPDGRVNTSSRTLQAGLAINGQGTGQTSTLYVVLGRSFVGSNGNVLAGGFTGTTRPSPTSLPTRFSGGIVASGSNVVLDGRNSLLSFSGAKPGSVNEGGTISPETGVAVSNPGRGTTTFDYTVAATRTTVPSGLGTNRPAINTGPNTNYGGMVGGLVTSVNNATRQVGPTVAISSGLFDLNLQPDNSQFGTNLLIGTTASGSDTISMRSANLAFGFQGEGSQDGRGTYIDSQNFGAREARNADGTFPSFVSGGGTVSEHRGAFVTSETVNARAYFPGVNFCQCEFTRWGFWSSETNRTNGSGTSITDLIHLGTFAFGPVAEFRDIPTRGVATYEGHAIASIRNGASEYIAAGNFQNAVNFGTRTGAVTVTGLDGRSYAGNVNLSSSSNAITGAIQSVAGGQATMTLNGQFSRGAIGPAGEMLGNLTINGGQTYIGGGIFAGAARSISP